MSTFSSTLDTNGLNITNPNGTIKIGDPNNPKINLNGSTGIITGQCTSLTAQGTSGYVYTSNGNSDPPTFQILPINKSIFTNKLYPLPPEDSGSYTTSQGGFFGDIFQFDQGPGYYSVYVFIQSWSNDDKLTTCNVRICNSDNNPQYNPLNIIHQIAIQPGNLTNDINSSLKLVNEANWWILTGKDFEKQNYYGITQIQFIYLHDGTINNYQFYAIMLGTDNSIITSSLSYIFLSPLS
jgi:hypothetical protein